MTRKNTIDCSDCVRSAAVAAWVAKPVFVLAAVFALSGNGDSGSHETVAQTASKGISAIGLSLQNLSLGNGLNADHKPR